MLFVEVDRDYTEQELTRELRKGDVVGFLPAESYSFNDLVHFQGNAGYGFSRYGYLDSATASAVCGKVQAIIIR